MKCPVCKEINLLMSDRNGVEIDYCPECRGVWLDRGELDKLLEKSKMEDRTTSPSPSYQTHNRPAHEQQSYYQHKRRKSFLEEIFD